MRNTGIDTKIQVWNNTGTRGKAAACATFVKPFVCLVFGEPLVRGVDFAQFDNI